MAMDKYANASFPAIGKAQMDLLVTALACGLTKVASIQWAHTVSPHVFTWAGVTQGHHDLSHMDDSNVAGVQSFVKAERWYTEQFAYLLTQLKSLPEPGGAGTMLDNTLVVWCKELGDGRLHDGKSVPFVLAGKANGFLLKHQRCPRSSLPAQRCRGRDKSLHVRRLVRIPSRRAERRVQLLPCFAVSTEPGEQ